MDQTTTEKKDSKEPKKETTGPSPSPPAASILELSDRRSILQQLLGLRSKEGEGGPEENNKKGPEKLKTKQETEISEQPLTSQNAPATELSDRHFVLQKILEPNNAERSGNYQESIEGCRKNLEEKRQKYIREYGEFIAEKKRKEKKPEILEKIKKELEISRLEYLRAKGNYTEILVTAKKQELQRAGLDSTDIKQGLNNFLQTEIFESLVINEENILQKEKAAAWPPQEKSWLRKNYEKWDDLSLVKKVLFTSTVTTGLTVASSFFTGAEVTALGLTGISLFFSKTFLCSLGSDLTSGLVGLGVNNLLTEKIEREFTMETEQLRQELIFNGLEKISEKYHDLIEQRAKKGGLALLTSAATMVLSGRAFSFGLELLSQTSLLREVTAAVSTNITGAGVMDRLSETETITKPAKNIFQKIFSFIKKNDLD